VQQHLAAYSNVLRIGASVRKSKDLVSNFEVSMFTITKGLDGAAELYTEGGRCLGWERVESTTLNDVHAVDAKGVNFDQSLAGGGRGSWRVIVDEKGIALTGAAFDV
jgi:hypothetical protein